MNSCEWQRGHLYETLNVYIPASLIQNSLMQASPQFGRVFSGPLNRNQTLFYIVDLLFS